MNPSAIVYLVGISLFGFFYAPLKGVIGDTWFFVGAAVLYLIFLRLAGDFIAKKWSARKRS